MKSTFLCGASMFDVTPTQAVVDNSLHGCMTVRFDENGSPLRAKALALSFSGTDALLVALDLVELPENHCNLLRQEISAKTGIQLHRIVITCTHSHSTPFVEPLESFHPFFDLVRRQTLAAADEAFKARRPARIGHSLINVVGASFNTRVPLPDGKVKFSRDFREGLASGRPIDPRLNILRFDDETGRPIAAWLRFAAHPACVIFDAPVSAEYPGYMTDCLSHNVIEGAPVLFGYGASADVNCIPMFGDENDSRRLGLQLADLAAPILDSMKTDVPHRFITGKRMISLPLDSVPSPETLDREISEIKAFMDSLDSKPLAEWVLGTNCKKDWPVEKKRTHVLPLLEWARQLKKAIESGVSFPNHWQVKVTAWVIDDIGMVFYPGEPFTELGLGLAARSRLPETLLMAMANGGDAGYLGTNEDKRRGGYETYTSQRYRMLQSEFRPFPYALGASEHFLQNCVDLLEKICEST